MIKLLLAFFILGMAISCSEQAELNWNRIEVNYGKPGAPVSLEYRIADTLQPGVEFDVEIAIASDTPAGHIDVSLNTEGNFDLLGSDQYAFNLSDPNKVLVVRLLSATDGPGYLNLNVFEHDESGNPLLGRSFSIPLKVGSGTTESKAKSGTLNIVEDGDELIIEMPAQSN